jgi:hypothetical protein
VMMRATRPARPTCWALASANINGAANPISRRAPDYRAELWSLIATRAQQGRAAPNGAVAPEPSQGSGKTVVLRTCVPSGTISHPMPDARKGSVSSCRGSDYKSETASLGYSIWSSAEPGGAYFLCFVRHSLGVAPVGASRSWAPEPQWRSRGAEPALVDGFRERCAGGVVFTRPRTLGGGLRTTGLSGRSPLMHWLHSVNLLNF